MQVRKYKNCTHHTRLRCELQMPWMNRGPQSLTLLSTDSTIMHLTISANVLLLLLLILLFLQLLSIKFPSTNWLYDYFMSSLKNLYEICGKLLWLTEVGGILVSQFIIRSNFCVFCQYNHSSISVPPADNNLYKSYFAAIPSVSYYFICVSICICELVVTQDKHTNGAVVLWRLFYWLVFVFCYL